MKLPGNMQSMMQQAQKMQQRMQEEVAAIRVEASAGGGMVTATMNGGMELVALKIDPAAIDPNDPVLLQDLVIAAVNQAIVKAQEMMQGEMQHLVGGMGGGLPPGLF